MAGRLQPCSLKWQHEIAALQASKQPFERQAEGALRLLLQAGSSWALQRPLL